MIVITLHNRTVATSRNLAIIGNYTRRARTNPKTVEIREHYLTVLFDNDARLHTRFADAQVLRAYVARSRILQRAITLRVDGNPYRGTAGDTANAISDRHVPERFADPRYSRPRYRVSDTLGAALWHKGSFGSYKFKRDAQRRCDELNGLCRYHVLALRVFKYPGSADSIEARMLTPQPLPHAEACAIQVAARANPGKWPEQIRLCEVPR